VCIGALERQPNSVSTRSLSEQLSVQLWGTGRLRLELLDYRRALFPATPEVLLAPAAPLVLGDPMDLLVPRSLLGKWKAEYQA